LQADRVALWVMPAMQLALLAFFTAVALWHVFYGWILLLPAFVTGGRPENVPQPQTFTRNACPGGRIIHARTFTFHSCARTFTFHSRARTFTFHSRARTFTFYSHARTFTFHSRARTLTFHSHVRTFTFHCINDILPRKVSAACAYRADWEFCCWNERRRRTPSRFGAGPTVAFQRVMRRASVLNLMPPLCLATFFDAAPLPCNVVLCPPYALHFFDAAPMPCISLMLPHTPCISHAPRISVLFPSE
jgi:hypothetical protein